VQQEYDVLVSLHGYSPTGMQGGKPPKEVWGDRLRKTLDTASLLDSWGLSVAIALSGGGDYDQNTEAQLIHEFAKSSFPEILEYDIFLEDDSTTTKSNVEQLYSMAQDINVAVIFTVTSRDHAPRVQRDWENYLNREEDTETFAASVASREAYAKSDRDPFILEDGPFGPFIDALQHIWGIPADRRREAARDVREILEEYAR